MATRSRLSERPFRKIGFGGFTLAELIVVITILAVLATIGFLALSGYSQDAKVSAIKANVRSLYTAIGAESAITGNSPRYYVVHDPSASIAGAFMYVDGKSVALTGGNWNDANTNYSAGNPDYVKLKLNPDKFRISSVGNVFNVLSEAGAAYDPNAVSIGATDVQGTTRTNSYYQVSDISPSGTTVVIGNYSASSGSVAGLIDDPASSGTGALTDGQTLPAGSMVTASLASATLPKGKLTISYNNGAGYDFKPLYSVSGDASYNSASVTWAVTSGSLPAGLSLGSNGVISGTPAALNAGATFEITGTYSGKTAKQTYVLVVIDNLLEAAQVSNGANFSCAVTLAGGVKCWGDNSLGQLGDGTTTARLVPVDVTGLSSGVAEVSAGVNFACAVLTNGTIKCWGHNGYGQLGKGSGGNASTPTLVSGIASGATHVTTGGRHACAVVSGAAKCWGYNYNYQLGNSSSADSNAPVSVTGLSSGVTDVSAGDSHSCAVVNGGVKCWGINNGYQLGDGTTTGRNAPVDVVGLTSGVSAISAGSAGTCVITTSGGAKCWGGYAGNGTTVNQSAAVDVTGMTSGVSKIRVGNNGHTCLLTAAGAAYCWGYNGGEGRNGEGVSYSSTTSVPTAVAGSSSGISDITAGSAGCALKNDSTVKCWGYYAGNNTSSAQYSPVPVMGG